MTIQIVRPGTANHDHMAYGVTTARADVWDIPAPAVSHPVRVDVRTLTGSGRTPERYDDGSTRPHLTGSASFENRHENRASLVMGAALGLALVLGSLVGGAFSAGADAGLDHGAGDSDNAMVLNQPR